MAHIPIIIFSFAYLRPSLLPQNYIYTYWKVYFHLTGSAMFFWPSIAMITAGFFLKKKKKTTAIETNVVSDCMMLI